MSVQGVVGVGISTAEVCGVRDAACVLADALSASGIVASTHWCELSETAGWRGRRQSLAAWSEGLRSSVTNGDVSAVVLHYSVFEFGPHGVPVHALGFGRALASLPVPVVGFLHELAYPFGRRGLRGTAHAVTQRVGLIPIVRASDALVVTTEQRAEWVRGRRWLPRRPVRFVPVFSNFPAQEPRVPDGPIRSVGVFGFASPGIEVPAVAEALRLLASRGRPVELVLLGAPGPDSAAAEEWRRGFGRAATSVRFTGILPPSRLAAELAAVDVLLFPDRGGASSRKGTLAAALSAGRPVVAVEGPEQWGRVIAENAVVVAAPDPAAVAAALEQLSDDPGIRREFGARAEAFYRLRMSPEVAGEAIRAILVDLAVAARPRTLVGA